MVSGALSCDSGGAFKDFNGDVGIVIVEQMLKFVYFGGEYWELISVQHFNHISIHEKSLMLSDLFFRKSS